jgi:hypothetical protein
VPKRESEVILLYELGMMNSPPYKSLDWNQVMTL